MEKRIEQLEASIHSVSSELKQLGELVAAGFRKVDANSESISKEIKDLHAQIDVLNRKVDLLQGDTNQGFDHVGLKLENLSEEIAKIGTATKYDEYFRNLKSINN